MKNKSIPAVIISFICLFQLQSLSNAVEVQVTITGHVESIVEQGSGVGATGVSEGEAFDLVFQYDLEKGELLSWEETIRQSYAEPIIGTTYSGMSGVLSIGSQEWVLLSENCESATIQLDHREILDAQTYRHYMRVTSNDVNNYPAHIYDSGFAFLLADNELPYELYDELQIPIQISDINLEAITSYDLKFWSHDEGDSPWDNSWYIELTYDNFEIIPEPATLLLLGLGGVILRRRRR